MKKKDTRIRVTVQLGLFSMNNAAATLYMAMMVYLSYYANGIAGFGVIMVSILLTGMHVFDGITDPIAGFLVDQTAGRFGKFRPYMLFGNLLMAASSLCLFYTTHLTPHWCRAVYFVLIYACFILGYTFQTVVGKSASSLLTSDPELRPLSTYFESLFYMAAYGGMSLYVSVYLVKKYGGFQKAELYQEMVLLVSVLGFLLTLGAMAGIWEKDRKPYLSGTGKGMNVDIRDYWEVLRHNRPIRMLIIAACTDKFASTVYGHATVSIMLFGILIGDYSIAGVIGLVAAVPSLIVVTLGIRIAQRFGQKRALVLFTSAACLLQIPMVFLLCSRQAGRIRLSFTGMNGITWAFLAVFVLLNGCRSVTNNMVNPMIADCTDYEVYRSGRYVPGLMGALFSFVDKVFEALGTAFVGLAMAVLGFSKALPQVGDPVTNRIKGISVFMYCVIPTVGWLCTLAAMRFYKLDKKKMLEINHQLG